MATRDDLAAIAEVVRGTELMVFSDEPYCHMVWSGRHASILAEPGMLEHTVAAYTFSKSYSMSGWRIGFAVAAPAIVDAIGKLINTTASCSPPFAQRAAQAALEHDTDDPRRLHGTIPPQSRPALRRSRASRRIPRRSSRPEHFMFSRTCERSATACKSPRTAWLCICSKGPTTDFGVACLGGECFGEAGQGFLRFSCAEPDERIDQAMAFIPKAIERGDRVRRYLELESAVCASMSLTIRNPRSKGGASR